MINKMPTFDVSNLLEFEQFLQWLVDNRINFHPDDDFTNYVSKDDTKSFSEDVGNRINYYFDVSRNVYKEELFDSLTLDYLKKLVYGKEE